MAGSKIKLHALAISMIVASLSGMVASYLALKHHVTHAFAAKLGIDIDPSFCNINSAFNCDVVNNSNYSTLAGLPVASYGLIFYLLVFLLSILALSSKQISSERYAAHFLLLSFWGVIVSIVLFAISKFLIGTICPLCLVVYIVNFLMLIAFLLCCGMQGFFSRLKSALIDLTQLPALILGAAQYKSSDAVALARFGFIALAISVYSFILLEDHFVFNFLTAEETQEKDIAKSNADIDLHLEDDLMIDYSKGPKDAPVKIIEFGDYECPACKQFYQVVEQIMEFYKDKIFYVLRNYPLDQACNKKIDGDFHKNACFAAELARCAGEQGRFWDMTDYLFSLDSEHATDSTLAREEMKQGIAKLSMDSQAVTECMNSGRQLKKIEQDVSVGDSLNINSTPSIWINGKLLTALKGEVIQKRIEEALNEAKSTH